MPHKGKQIFSAANTNVLHVQKKQLVTINLRWLNFVHVIFSLIVIQVTYLHIFYKRRIKYLSPTHSSGDRNWIIKTDSDATGWNGMEQTHLAGHQIAGSWWPWGSIKCVEFFSLAEKPLPAQERPCSVELPTWINISCALLEQLPYRLLLTVHIRPVAAACTAQWVICILDSNSTWQSEGPWYFI